MSGGFHPGYQCSELRGFRPCPAGGVLCPQPGRAELWLSREWVALVGGICNARHRVPKSKSPQILDPPSVICSSRSDLAPGGAVCLATADPLLWASSSRLRNGTTVVAAAGAMKGWEVGKPVLQEPPGAPSPPPGGFLAAGALQGPMVAVTSAPPSPAPSPGVTSRAARSVCPQPINLSRKTPPKAT